ncbi:MAG: class IV adenylate cyclase [Planctomycetaceae bacterium]|nr:class IV adenylate cyclase [Planctomycetaceae bacterium]
MLFEVEMKFAVSDVVALLETLQQEFGLTFGESAEEHDIFYQHPAKDFAKTDECLRIRQKAGQYTMTYKGPKIDSESKTRRELELFLTDQPETAKQWDELLQAVGFLPVAELKKIRRTVAIIFCEQKFSLMLDHLDGLGDFIEIETIADEQQLPELQKSVKSLAAMLRLSNLIVESYLELMMKYQNEN